MMTGYELRLVARHAATHYLPAMLRVAGKCLTEADDCEDAVQDVFVGFLIAQLGRGLGFVSVKGAFQRMAFGVARNQSRSRRREGARFAPLADDAPAPALPDRPDRDDQHVAYGAALAAFERWMPRLTRAEAGAARLWFEGVRDEKAAQVLDCSVGTLRTRLCRARAKLTPADRQLIEDAAELHRLHRRGDPGPAP